MFQLKLCALNSPTAIATQSCFDQNLLQITPISNFMNNPFNLSANPVIFYGNSYQQYVSNVNPTDTLPLVIDQFTIRDPTVAHTANINTHVYWNITFRQVIYVPTSLPSLHYMYIYKYSAQLPPGLVCSNCALQFEYKQRSGSLVNGWPVS